MQGVVLYARAGVELQAAQVCQLFLACRFEHFIFLALAQELIRGLWAVKALILSVYLGLGLRFLIRNEVFWAVRLEMPHGRFDWPVK